MKVQIENNEGIFAPGALLAEIRRLTSSDSEPTPNKVEFRTAHGNYKAFVDNVVFGEGYVTLRKGYEPRGATIQQVHDLKDSTLMIASKEIWGARLYRV